MFDAIKEFSSMNTTVQVAHLLFIIIIFNHFCTRCAISTSFICRFFLHLSSYHFSSYLLIQKIYALASLVSDLMNVKYLYFSLRLYVQVTSYVYERFVNYTFTMAMMNPGVHDPTIFY